MPKKLQLVAIHFEFIDPFLVEDPGTVHCDDETSMITIHKNLHSSARVGFLEDPIDCR